MKFALYLCAILMTILLLLTIRKYSSVEFVHHARLLFKTWSVWLASAGSVISAWCNPFLIPRCAPGSCYRPMPKALFPPTTSA